ncbi:MAG TPA: hypothetical protein VKX25_04245 [Bryobacteraceae bacterium]|jgi:hypothetical protein|nr:hypothetical protein [Bryobacteraceae bacterium]
MTLALSAGESSWRNPVEDLCDELMCHIFECASCINGFEDVCQTYRALNKEIAAAGGPTKGVALTM